jgi:hypothetical protein
VNRLRTVTAVLGTTTGFDGQQGGELNFIGVEMFAVNLLGFEQQIVEWQIEQLFDGLTRPSLHSFDRRAHWLHETNSMFLCGVDTHVEFVISIGLQWQCNGG